VETREIVGQNNGSFRRFIEETVLIDRAEELGIQSNTETDDGEQYIVEIEVDHIEGMLSEYLRWCNIHHEIFEPVNWELIS